MSGPFIQHVLNAASKPEAELAAASFEEFKRLSLLNTDDSIPLEHLLNSYALLAVALNWIDRPRVHTRVASDGVNLRDTLG